MHFLKPFSTTSCLQVVERKTQRGPQQSASRQPVAALQPASDAASQLLLFPRRNRIPLIRNPIAPASYPPTIPYARRVPQQKSRGSKQRGGNASEDMPAYKGNDLPWLRLDAIQEQETRGRRGWRNNMVRAKAKYTPVAGSSRTDRQQKAK